MWKNQHLFIIQTLIKLRKELFPHVKNIYEKLTAKIILNSERKDASCLNQEQNRAPPLSIIIREVLG